MGSVGLIATFPAHHRFAMFEKLSIARNLPYSVDA